MLSGHRTSTALLLLLLLTLLSCRGGVTEATSLSDAPSGHEALKTEGREDLCEHGVLKAICPKCNPKLAAVFQAKGDWCAEHGLPESVCPICHPERGGRPAANVSAGRGEKAKEGDAPADGTKVRFKTKETARLAGILTVKAEERPGGNSINATAKLTYDATRLAVINARSPGVVRALNVDVGAKVKKGAALAVIESAGVGADRSKLQAASSRAEIAKQNLERAQALRAEGVSSAKEVLDAQQELAAAKAEQAALTSSLSIVGAGAGSGGSYTLTAPLGGVVTRRNATIGKLVGAEELLLEIVDTSAMWADVDVPETELAAVAPEQPVVVKLDGLGDREFKGTISYVSPEIDVHTRTATARVPLVNPEGALRANMYGQARIFVGGARVSVVIPLSAVQRAKTVSLVFVRLAEDEYEARRVELGASDGDHIEILKGIRPGEDVVTQGSFLLKTETLKESIGAGCCAVD